MLKNLFYSTFFLKFIVINFLVIISFVQIFPQDFFFSSGDSIQIVSFKTWLSNNYSLWSDSSGIGGGLGFHNNHIIEIPYYFIIDFVSNILGLKIHQQAILHHFFFYSFSYFSFLFYLKKQFDFLSSVELTVIPLIYIINIITFYKYFYTWGYTPFYYLYVFIPLFISFITSFFKIDGAKNTIIFSFKILPIILISNISFSNASFLLSFFFFINLFILFNLLVGGNDYKKNVYKGIYINFLFLILLLPSFLSLINDLNESYQGSRNQIWNELQWVKNQAAAFPKPFFFFDGYLLVKKNVFIQYQYFFFILIIIFLIFDIKKKEPKNLYNQKIFFFFLLILIIFIHNKGINFLSDYQIYNVFVNSFYYIFRSSDKIMIYYPIIVITLLVLFLGHFKKKIYIFISIIIFNSVICYPLIVGGIKKNYDLTVGEKDNFLLSEYSMIKKFSIDYKFISELLNKKNDYDRYGILNLPFTGITSSNWSNYQKNQHVGFDPYFQFFKHRMFSLNDWGTKEMDFIGRNFNKSNPIDDWYKKIFKLFPVKYIIFHKDTHDFLYNESKNKIDQLESQKIIKKLYNGDQLVLYEIISRNYYNEIIYIPLTQIETSFKSYNKFSEVLEKKNNITDKNYIIKFGNINYYHYDELSNSRLFANGKKNKKYFPTQEEKVIKINNEKLILNVKKISSTKYNINISNISSNEITLAFLNTFSIFWKIVDQKELIRVKEHFKCNGYANCYKIETVKKNISFNIEYIPQIIIDILIPFYLVLLLISIFLYKKFCKL